MINIKATESLTYVDATKDLYSGAIEYDKVSIELDSSWDIFITKKIVFSDEDDNVTEVDYADPVDIPDYYLSIKDKVFKIGLYGQELDQRKTTNFLYFTVDEGSYKEGVNPPSFNSDIASCIFYQTNAQDYLMQTTGQNTYVGNKVDLDLTQFYTTTHFRYDTDLRAIVYEGDNDILVNFNATATIDRPSANNTTIHFILMKNGVEQEQTKSHGKLESLSGAMGLNAASGFYLTKGDKLEVFTETDKNNSQFYVNNMQLQFSQNLSYKA